MIYYLAVCKCGEIQSSSTSKTLTEATFHCRKCNRNIRIHNKRQGFLNVRILKSAENPQFIAQLNGAVKHELYVQSMNEDLDALNQRSKQLWGF